MPLTVSEVVMEAVRVVDCDIVDDSVFDLVPDSVTDCVAVADADDD